LDNVIDLKRDIFSEDLNYQKYSKNIYDALYDEGGMERDNKAISRLTEVLLKALDSGNSEMVRIWFNQREALLRKLHWNVLQKQATATEFVSSTA